jgi:CheY-like chemotaxis protein
MSGDLVSLRILAVASAADRDLLRQGASVVAIPVDVLEADNVNAASRALARGDIDVIFLDAALPVAERTAVFAAARSLKPPSPFVITLTVNKEEAAALATGGGTDGAVIKPRKPEEAKALIERAIHARLPKRVLVVDDSGTMRSIVRKILSASRFQLEVAEAKEGIEAIKQSSSGRFDLVIVDYNMPGLNGIETLTEIKRQFPRLIVVMMTSTPDEAIAERARAAGAAAFLKKPFYPTDIDAVFHSVFGLRVR